MSIDSENELFQLKSKFLREIPHPALILKVITQTQLPRVAAPVIESISKDVEKVDLIVFLKKYLTEVGDIKLQIANASTSLELNKILVQLYKCQWTLLYKLTMYTPELEQYPDEALKMSDSVDVYSIVKFLESIQIKENEIKTYICTTILNELSIDFDVLTKACLRSRKICVHARSV